MKRFIIQVSLAILIILMQMFCISANAVEVNGNEAQLGQTITYEIHASGCPNIIQAVDVEVTYDSTALEYIPDSIQMPNLTGTLVNDQEKDTIKFNALDLNGFSFYTDNIVATMQFRVISDHAPYLYIKSDIRNFIDDELKDHKDEYVYYLTLTEDEIKQIETVSEEITEKNTDNTSSSENSIAAKTDSSKTESGTENGISSANSEVSEVSADTNSDKNSEQPQSQTVSKDTLDHPYGNNAHDDTVTAVASKPVNYSVIFFAAAGMLVLIAIIEIVLLTVMKTSEQSDETKK